MPAEETHINSIEHKEISCPKCGQTIVYYDTEGSSYYGCSNCHTYFRYEHDDQPEILDTFRRGYSFTPDLKPGEKATFHGTEFVVTGYMEKHDTVQNVYWREYMLFSPSKESYYVLAHAEGEWYLVWESQRQDFTVMNTNVMNPEYVAMQQDPYKKYEHFTSYTFDITYAAGEFDTNILDDIDKVYVEEYMDPPDMLVSEKKNSIKQWYRGLNISEYELKQAFGEEVADRFPTTFYDTYNRQWLPVFYTGMITMGMILITYAMFTSLKPSRYLINQTFVTSNDNSSWQNPPPVNAGIINVNGPAALSFMFSTSVNNSWMELSVSMVNTATGKTYEFTKPVEYYSGYEEGEHWSEGSQSADAILSRIPSGEYQVNVFVITDMGTTQAFTMQVEENTTL
ncbi:MAG: DUF4178 domain-containing protein, partial [Chitinophagaceae bacterium]|nr:DUF4178 domain-containing protein [Chitinophagaceae bacterium]